MSGRSAGAGQNGRARYPLGRAPVARLGLATAFSAEHGPDRTASHVQVPAGQRAPRRRRLHHAAPGNRLLKALPAAEYARIAPHLSAVRVEAGQVLYEPGERPKHVYFPETAVLSMVVVMSDGSTVTTAIVGNEGMVGLSALLGTASMTTRCLAQLAGTAQCMSVAAFGRAAAESPRLESLLRRYTQAFINQVSQVAACNLRHGVRQRCAAVLLLMQDRAVGADTFPVTHEDIAVTLGVRREAVTMAARELQEAGLIRYSRGRVAILDRRGLERAACECYDIITASHERALD
jgi:CRP-like cAMP-binding protein